MPRRPRIQATETFFHLSTTSVRKTPLFRDDTDRELFYAILESVVLRHEWIVYAYCLMTTHYHLSIRTTEDGELAAAMQRLNGLYARTFNCRHGEKGHVFRARYSSLPIETNAHLLEVCRYVALNPVRAGLCIRPERWPWSSYRIALGLSPGRAFFDPRRVLKLFGDSPDRARAAYKRFVESPLDVDDPFTVPGNVKGGTVTSARPHQPERVRRLIAG